MGQIIKKTFTAKTIGKADIENHTVEVVVSTNRRDRHGEVILHEAWEGGLDDFKRQNGPLLSQHDYWGNLRSHIGMTQDIRLDMASGLIPKFKYFIGDGVPQNEEVEWAWFLVTQESAAFSVGFIDLVYELGNGVDAPFVTYKKVNLLEVSQVLIGANPDAVQNALRNGVIGKDYSEYLLQDTGRRSVVVPDAYENVTRSIHDIQSAMAEMNTSLVNLTEKFAAMAGGADLREVKGQTLPRSIRLNLRKEST